MPDLNGYLLVVNAHGGAGGSYDPDGRPYGVVAQGGGGGVAGHGGSGSRRMIDGRWYVSLDGGRTYTRED